MLKINTVTRCYLEIKYNIRGCVVSYNFPFDVIRAKKLKNGKYKTPEFYIVVDICLKDSLKQENPIFIKEDKKIDFEIRLTKCSEDENKRMYFDLNSFSVTPSYLLDKSYSKETSMDFINHQQIIHVNSLEVTELGKYVLKVATNYDGKEKYVQSISSFEIM